MRSDRCVVLTRAPEDNFALRHELEARGWRVVEAPCVRTERLADTAALRNALAGLAPSDVLVLTSRSGADAVAEATTSVPCDVAVVGHATAERARAHGMRVRFVASRPDGRTLARELPLPRGDVVLARSDRAERELPDALRERGARVREVVAYRTVPEVPTDALSALVATPLDAATIVVASPSAVEALVSAVGRTALGSARFVAIGPRTAERVREIAGAGARIAADTDTRSIADAVEDREEAIR